MQLHPQRGVQDVVQRNLYFSNCCNNYCRLQQCPTYYSNQTEWVGLIDKLLSYNRQVLINIQKTFYNKYSKYAIILVHI